MVEAYGGEFWVLFGRDFDYAAYRREVLQAVADEFYDIPPWLARWMRGSFFLERYGVQPAGAKGGEVGS